MERFLTEDECCIHHLEPPGQRPLSSQVLHFIVLFNIRRTPLATLPQTFTSRVGSGS